MRGYEKITENYNFLKIAFNDFDQILPSFSLRIQTKRIDRRLSN